VSIFEIPARLAVHTVDDLVGLVPYLIGFHPADSLVVVVLCDGRVEVTARVDLADVVDPDAMAYLFARLFERFPSAEAWVLAYTADEDLAWDTLAAGAALCGVMRLGRLIHVGDTSWRCDTPDGDTGGLGISSAAVQAAVIGLPLRRSRAELRELVAGPDDREVDELCELFERLATQVAELGPRPARRLLQRLLRPGGERVRADWVRLAVLAADPEAVATLLGSMDAADAAHLVALWTQVVRHCLVPYLPNPLGLLGVASWLTGDGAMAVICLERLQLVAPASPMAALLDVIIAQVLPPSSWPEHRAALVGAVRDWFDRDAQR